MNEPMSIEVRGKRKRWVFHFKGDPRHLADWRADGLQVSPVANVIPEWIVDLGLLHPWCWLQDLWKWLWRDV